MHHPRTAVKTFFVDDVKKEEALLIKHEIKA